MLDLGSAVGYLLLDTKGFSSGFTSALQSVKTMQSQSATTADKFTAMGTAMTSVGGKLTKSVTLPLVGLGTAAVKTAADFEKGMSQVQATTRYTKDTMVKLDGASVNAMDALSDLAQEMGATTKFSATEAAEAINNMAMAGYSVQEIYDSLPGVLNLASAGALDLDYSTQLVANGLNVMGMETSEVTELADKMAVTATKAYGSVSDFGEGLLVAGAQAKLANVSLTDTFTALGILGDNGISASEGGTYLRNTLKNLYTPTKDAADALNALGVKTADDNGKLKDFQVVLQELGAALDGLTEEQRITYMSRIFDTRTISAANALIANSTERWDELSAAIDNASGAAEEMKNAQLDNLSGQLTILKSSIEGAAIAFGNAMLPVIKDLVSAFQSLMNWLNGLDEAQQKTLVTILEVVAAIGPLLVIFGKLSGVVGTVINLFSGAGGLSAALTVITGPIGIVIAAVAALAAAWATDFGGIREFTSEVFGEIAKTVQYYINLVKTVWNNDLYGIRTTAQAVWSAIQTIFSSTFGVIASLFKAFLAVLRGDWSAAGEWFQEALQRLVQAVLNIGGALFNAGRSIISSLWDGVKSIWSSVASWFEEKLNWVSNIFSRIKSFGSGISGSYASGLDYVTHDRVVQVHEGEAILTKEENKERLNNRNSGGDTFNFYSPTALNPTTAAREMKKAKQQLALGLA